MKYAEPRPWADPAVAARKLLEIANGVETVQDGRIHIEKINGPMLFTHGASPNTAPVCAMASTRAGFGCTRAEPS